MANNEKPAVSSTDAVKKETGKKASFPKRVAKWFREMVSELKKVIWPTPKQTAGFTAVALVVMVVASVFIWGFDQIAQFIVSTIISLAG